MHRFRSLAVVAVVFVLFGGFAKSASAQPMTKARVADLIVKVENGVDQFRDYLKHRGDNAKDAAGTAQASGRARTKKGATQAQKDQANDKKDRLDDALGDLNKSTNRLRRKFDATDTWMETKSQVERVVEDGRKVNAELTRGSYGTEAARLWGVLKVAINDLARAYGVPPLGI